MDYRSNRRYRIQAWERYRVKSLPLTPVDFVARGDLADLLNSSLDPFGATGRFLVHGNAQASPLGCVLGQAVITLASTLPESLGHTPPIASLEGASRGQAFTN